MFEDIKNYAQFKAKFLLNDFLGILHKHKKGIENCPVSSAVFDCICRLLYHKLITRDTAKETLRILVNDKRDV